MVPQLAHWLLTPLLASLGSVAFLLWRRLDHRRVGWGWDFLSAHLFFPAPAPFVEISLHSHPSWRVLAQTRCLHFLLVQACFDHPETKVYNIGNNLGNWLGQASLFNAEEKSRWCHCTWMVILPSASNPITLRCCWPLIMAVVRTRASIAETWCQVLTQGKILSNILRASCGATGCLRIRHHLLPPAPLTLVTTAALFCGLYHWISIGPHHGFKSLNILFWTARCISFLLKPSSSFLYWNCLTFNETWRKMILPMPILVNYRFATWLIRKWKHWMLLQWDSIYCIFSVIYLTRFIPLVCCDNMTHW